MVAGKKGPFEGKMEGGESSQKSGNRGSRQGVAFRWGEGVTFGIK